MTSDPWASLALSTDGLTARYCELNHLGEWLRQPSNALSSFSYVIAGVLVLLNTTGRVAKSLRFTLAASFFALGLGSQFFHASITLIAQQLDMAGTYATVLALIAIGLQQRFPRLHVLAPLLVTDVLFYAFDLYLQGTWLLPLLIAIALIVTVVVALHEKRPALHFGLAFLGLTIGGASWGFDDRKFLCDPQSVLQWHALWHLATAFGAYQLFLFLNRGRSTDAHGALHGRVSAGA